MTDLLRVIRKRQSSRIPFDPDKPVSRLDLLQILEAGRWAPTAHNMQNFEIVLVDDRQQLDRIRQLDFPVSETFIRENYLQLSFSETELKKKKTGVLGDMFPPAWLNPTFLPEHIDEEDMEVIHPLTERHNHLLPCPVLVLMLYDPRRRAPASEGDFLGIMSLGCALENMWLMAASLGIGFHVVSALSGFYVEGEIRKILAIPAHLNIGISFRLGYPLGAPRYMRVRRDLNDFIHHNKYGMNHFSSSL